MFFRVKKCAFTIRLKDYHQPDFCLVSEYTMKTLTCAGSAKKTKYVLTRNIIILSLTLSPLAHATFEINNNLKNPETFAHTQLLGNIATKRYTVNIGETAETIAQKFNMNLEQLQELNSKAPYTKQLSELKPGDILLVPLTALPREIATPKAHIATAEEIQQQAKIANLASQVGTSLSSDTNNADAASSLVRNIATNAVNSGLENWFSKYGRLRAQIATDEKFSLKNSQFDAMLPLWENDKNLFFTQTSFHNTDDRNQGNLGFGLRHFYDNFMIGGNTFIDYDFSNKHQRAGIGAEYWSNFLKVSANGYMRLSDWKESKQVEDYSERAANGWDLRAEGYLPIYPQLGGKLMFEQYYGDEVALFGHNNDHRKDPNAVTAGISYTPVPLVSLSVDHKQGQDGQKDTIFGLQMNYQIGVPFAKQIDPRAVAALRSLAGNKYDFVDRNNNIILEYKKNETIWLHLDPELQGLAGETKALNVSVESKHGLDHIEWNATSLTAAGGEIIQNGNSYSIKMPTYQTGRDAAANSYTISAVAFDTKGNPSARQSMTVKVTQETDVNTINSTFTPENSTITANGTDEQVLTLTLKDANNNLLDVDASEITIANNAAKGTGSAQVGEVTKTSTGVFEVKVTAGTVEENLTLTPTARGVRLSSSTIKVSADTISEADSTFTASKKEIAANSGEETTLTLSLMDANKNPITGKNVSFNVTNSLDGVTIGPVTEKNGVYTAKLQGTKGGIVNISPAIEGKTLELTEQVVLTTSVIVIDKSEIKVLQSLVHAGEEFDVAVKLIDENDNPVTQGNVTLVPSGLENVSVSDAIYENGVYKLKVTSEFAGELSLKVKYNESVLTVQTNVNILDNISIENSTFSPLESSLRGNDVDRQQYVLYLYDSNGQPIDVDPKDIDLDFKQTILNQGSTIASLSQLKEDSPGAYTFFIAAGSSSEQITITPTVQGTVFPTANLTITTDSLGR